MTWKNAPSIWVGPQQQFTATDIQTGWIKRWKSFRGACSSNSSIQKERLRFSDMERCSCSSREPQEGALFLPSLSLKANTKHSHEGSHSLQYIKQDQAILNCWQNTSRQASIYRISHLLLWHLSLLRFSSKKKSYQHCVTSPRNHAHWKLEEFGILAEIDSELELPFLNIHYPIPPSNPELHLYLIDRKPEVLRWSNQGQVKLQNGIFHRPSTILFLDSQIQSILLSEAGDRVTGLGFSHSYLYIPLQKNTYLYQSRPNHSRIIHCPANRLYRSITSSDHFLRYGN